ncbi:MAG: hypothetical protein ACRC33_19860 [Gemmataceae bacterium]
MSRELLSAWFGVPAESWPPDHYRLLGLTAGEPDLDLVERRVHERMDEVRRYQVMHPEPATEAMNRLAQAFVCLSDAQQKRAYDATLVPAAPPPPPPPVPPPSPDVPHAWLHTPGEGGPGGAAALVVEPPPAVEVMPPVPVDVVEQAARASPQARHGLATRRALFQRIARTRQVMRSWFALGRFLEDETRQLTRPQAKEMFKLIERIEEELHDFPLMGEAGQPGYLIVTLTRLDKSKTLVNLAPSQREALSRDWKAGLKFLRAHRDYLRDEVRTHRRRGWWEGTVRSFRAVINEQPLAALVLLLALAALGVAVWRQSL